MLKKDFFEQLFYQSSIAQLLFSEDYEEKIANEAFYTLTGYSQGELTVEYLQKLLHGLNVKNQTQATIPTKNGKSKVCLIHKEEITPSASPKIFHLQLTDITEKAHRERIIHLIADHSQDVINLHRLDGSYIYTSPAVKEVIGYEPHEMIDKLPHDFIHEEDVTHCIEKHMELLEKKGPVMMTYRLKRKDGAYVWLESAVKPIVNETTGEVSEIISISRNIESRMKASELLEKSKKLAIIGRMSAALAHEVRNPLTPIKGFIQLFQATKEYNEEYGKIILTELERVENIISEFLTLSKPHHERVGEVDIVGTVKKVIRLLKTEALLENKTIQFIYDSKEKFFIQGDLTTVKQVFVNVIQNALDAISAKTGLITITVEKGQEKNVCIKVRDNGSGIEKDRLSMLGEPFYSTKEKGIGLGLMTSFRIIENHKGKIAFTSDLGKGTEVSIHLPLMTSLSTPSPQL